MSKELNTLKEVARNLIIVSDVFESVRKKFSVSQKNLLEAQEYLVASIGQLKKGINDIEQQVSKEINEQSIAEDEIENRGE